MQRKINKSDLTTLATIMAANGHVPSFGGWRAAGDGHSPWGPLGVCGRLGQIATYGDRQYVCVAAGSDDPRASLPNSHPDYVPAAAARWVRIPLPEEVDWRYIRPEYHRQINVCRIAGVAA